MQNSFRQYNSQGFRIDKTFFFLFFFLPIRSGFFFFFFFTKQFFLTIWLKITNAFKSKALVTNTLTNAANAVRTNFGPFRTVFLRRPYENPAFVDRS